MNSYLEVNQNDIRTVEAKIYRDDGTPYSPSGAFITVKGRQKDNIVVPRMAIKIGGRLKNEIYFRLTDTVTASAAEYDIKWEVRKNDDVAYHCTKLLVIDSC